MSHKKTLESVRFVPVAMGLILLFLLGALAFVARAEEDVTDILDSTQAQSQMKADMEARRALMQEQMEEKRTEFSAGISNEAVSEMRQWSGSTSPRSLNTGDTFEQNRAQFEERKAEMQENFAEHKSEMMQDFEERKEALQQQLQERKQEREERAEEYKARLSVQSQARLSTFSERMTSKMDSALSRLEQIAEKIEARIYKIEEEHDVSLTEARTALAEVYALIASAHDSVLLTADVSVDTLTSEDPQEQIQELREAVKITKDSIVKIHQQMKEVVVAIKASAENLDRKPTKGGGGESDEQGDEVVITHTYEDGVHTYSSALRTLNVCFEVEAMALVAESYPEQITIDITATAGPDGTVCAPGEVDKEFSVEVTASEEAKLMKVRVNNEDVVWSFE